VVLDARAQLANHLTLGPRGVPEQTAYLRESQALLEQVLAVSEQARLPPPPMTRTLLARSLISSPLREDDGPAEDLLRRDARFLEAHYPPNHSYHDFASIVLAHLLVENGGFDEAERLLDRVEKRNRPQLPKPKAHFRLNAVLMLQATIAGDRGDRERARQILEEALAIASEDYPPDHRFVVTAKRAIENLRNKGHFREY
jgi:tetratricopeptide (TPR) repeat protein